MFCPPFFIQLSVASLYFELDGDQLHIGRGQTRTDGHARSSVCFDARLYALMSSLTSELPIILNTHLATWKKASPAFQSCEHISIVLEDFLSILLPGDNKPSPAIFADGRCHRLLGNPHLSSTKSIRSTRSLHSPNRLLSFFPIPSIFAVISLT